MVHVWIPIQNKPNYRKIIFDMKGKSKCGLVLDNIFKNILFIYSWETQRERQRAGGGRHRQREKQALCGEPNAGLDPRAPGSHPEPKADAQPLSNPGILRIEYFRRILIALNFTYYLSVF